MIQRPPPIADGTSKVARGVSARGVAHGLQGRERPAPSRRRVFITTTAGTRLRRPAGGHPITLIDRDVPSYFQSPEHLLRYCAPPTVVLEQRSVIGGTDGRITRVHDGLTRHWVTIVAANWFGPGRGPKSTRPGFRGVVELSPFESWTSSPGNRILRRRADLVPSPRKHRHRSRGVFTPNQKLRRAVTALAIGNVGRRGEALTGGQSFRRSARTAGVRSD